MTIHLVYPHQNKISAPNVIGYKLLQGLSIIDNVKAYEWDSFSVIKPDPGDVLMGHVHPAPGTIMRRSLKRSGWKRKIILQPYNEDVKQVGYLDSVIDDCDTFLAITGSYWFERISQSPFRRWAQKMVHIDLAVDQNHYKKIKFKFSDSGKRKFVYIGNNLHCKNLDYLQLLAKALPQFEFHWIGKGSQREPLIKHGRVDFSTDAGRTLIAEFDFMITVGSADANPTTILEAMSWGLIPVCTPTSGYVNNPGIVNIPLNDVSGASKILIELNVSEVQALESIRNQGYHQLKAHFNWERFEQQVVDEVSSNENRQIIKVGRTLLSYSLRQRLIYSLKAITHAFYRG
jgi:glycosyltransferase involved in cell wall biosynthesis